MVRIFGNFCIHKLGQSMISELCWSGDRRSNKFRYLPIIESKIKGKKKTLPKVENDIKEIKG